ncbi:integrase core domain-containing protein [Streptomyces violaceus]|uniref:integrase core domain-containing protein n=1 Tax=Streptomyces violaceus TaxID=1936 RepID=UPI00399D5DAB
MPRSRSGPGTTGPTSSSTSWTPVTVTTGYKTELIKPRKPWHGLADVELGTAEWGDWFNNQRLHTAIGDIPPHEHETNHYAHHQPRPAAGVNA